MWDYVINGEPKPERTKRLQQAQMLCWTCPLIKDCRNWRNEIEALSFCPVDGVWGGAVFAGRRNTSATLAASA
ncbi:WhiB family transcriptional regulator [Nocardia wallacei]|uniref:WhiB family transcriptional regulator n=1 Tax=Nocardia wallacei TaxID=480035 RepID=UPI003CC7F5AD